jgi:large subunit ribosomal protein L9
VKVILTEEIPILGKIGTVVDVARGYGRNYLIPQGKALEATPSNISRFEQQRTRITQLQTKEKEEAVVFAARLEGLILTIQQRVGEKDRLYGSVTNQHIAEALAAKGITVDRKKLELPEPIKSLGTYEVTARLHSEVKARLRVEVVPENV